MRTNINRNVGPAGSCGSSQQSLVFALSEALRWPEWEEADSSAAVSDLPVITAGVML